VTESTANPNATDNGLSDIVAALRCSREVADVVRHRGRVRELPSRKDIEIILDDLSAVLFPTHYGRPDLSDESIDYFVGAKLNSASISLTEQVRRSLLFAPDDIAVEGNFSHKAGYIVRSFMSELAGIRALLVSDLRAAYQGDPAATSISEILICYPGILAIIHYRLAHALYRLGAAFVARLISSIAQSQTGIDIHPGAEIGSAFFIDHGTGVVIGETTIIGKNVRLYQHVTLGAKNFPADETGALIKGSARHPIIEDDVIIYAGATILGRVTIGRGSTIGGNVWLTQSVAADSNVTQAQTRYSGGDASKHSAETVAD
jgi:serine O-acetyltransferase